MKTHIPTFALALNMFVSCHSFASAQFFSTDPGIKPPFPGTQGSRDAGAIAILEQSLTAQGGKQQWEAITNITLSGLLQDTPSGSQESPIKLEYDWTGKNLRFRSETTRGDHHTVRISSKDGGVHVASDGQQKDLSKQIQPKRLPPEIPAVSFTLALDSPDFYITSLPECPSTLECVRISPLTKNRVSAVGTADWFITKSTHLPDHVSTYANDQIHRGILLQTTWKISSYQTFQGLLVPATLAMSEMGAKRRLTFTSISVSQSPNNGDFDIASGAR